MLQKPTKCLVMQGICIDIIIVVENKMDLVEWSKQSHDSN